jgi:hypothetical protein
MDVAFLERGRAGECETRHRVRCRSRVGVFMRVATVVLGAALLFAGGVSGASESSQNPAAHRAAAVLADGVINSPAAGPLSYSEMSQAQFDARYLRNGAGSSLSALGFVPSQGSTWVFRTSPTFGEPRAERFDPARIPLPAKRTSEDHFLTAFIAIMLIAYQLRRKHRFLRPHQFST